MSRILVENAVFITVCELLEELEVISRGHSVIPKKRLHIRAISRWFDRFSGGDVYFLFRLLVPEVLKITHYSTYGYLDRFEKSLLLERKEASHAACRYFGPGANNPRKATPQLARRR